ncbi:polymer-forming cytoskeletal protein [Candidatus Uhrbacteria bacterium]|nr:polymer-forming cytoskeletal protein [Candidatus Uhrbacteria bacterium]
MSNKENSGNEAETVIAASVRVEGDFASQGNVLIEGTVEGSLRTERNLRVGERANISADVFAANASVAGEITGNITVSERLELEPTARIHGDIRTKSLVVANGAMVEGRISMEQKAEGGAADRGKAKASVRETAGIRTEGSEKAGVTEEETSRERVTAAFGR